jgi:ADP-heptose:LPS heptosyltransferase
VRADDLGDNILGSGLPRALARSVSASCGLVANPAAIDLVDVRGLDFVAGVDCRPRNRRDVLRAGRGLRRALAAFDPDVVLLPRFGFEREALGIALVSARPPTVVTWSPSATAKRARRSWWLSLLPGPRLPGDDSPPHELDRLRAFSSWIGLDPNEVGPALDPRLVDPAPLPIGLADHGPPLVCIGIGAAQGRRRWPPERFAALVRTLAGTGRTCALLGSLDERELARAVCDPLGELLEDGSVVDLVGHIPLRATAHLLGRSVLYVGNDSGIGHVAAAAGTPSVTISCHPVGAPTNHVNAPERYAPSGDRTVVVRPARPHTTTCARGCVPVDEPCCVLEVSTEAVLDASLSLLAATADSDVDATRRESSQ